MQDKTRQEQDKTRQEQLPTVHCALCTYRSAAAGLVCGPTPARKEKMPPFKQTFRPPGPNEALKQSNNENDTRTDTIADRHNTMQIDTYMVMNMPEHNVVIFTVFNYGTCLNAKLFCWSCDA